MNIQPLYDPSLKFILDNINNIKVIFKFTNKLTTEYVLFCFICYVDHLPCKYIYKYLYAFFTAHCCTLTLLSQAIAKVFGGFSLLLLLLLQFVTIATSKRQWVDLCTAMFALNTWIFFSFCFFFIFDLKGDEIINFAFLYHSILCVLLNCRSLLQVFPFLHNFQLVEYLLLLFIMHLVCM